MESKDKKRILLVVGAGGSVDVGYPSMNDLNEEIEFQLKSYKDLFNLYSLIKNILNDKSDKKLERLDKVIEKIQKKIDENSKKIKENPKKELRNLILKNDDLIEELNIIKRILVNNFSFEQIISVLIDYLSQKRQIELVRYIEKIRNFTNFEEIAYVCLKLYSYLQNENTPISKEIFDIKNGLLEFNQSQYYEKLYNKIVEIVIRKLSFVDKNNEIFDKIKKFYLEMKENFEIGIITTNYDPLLYEIFPDFFMGFDKENGQFLNKEIWSRKKWEFLYHIHGSVYNKIKSDEIIWRKELPNDISIPINDGVFFNKQKRDAGELIIRQPIVVGYDKQQQIMYNPFRTFFANLNRLVMEADGVIFIGYGFNDIHLNATFENFRKEKKKKVIVIDYFENSKDENENIVTERLTNDSKRWQKYCECFGLYRDYMSKKLQRGEVEYHTKNENPDNINNETIIYKLGLVAATKYIDEIIKFFNYDN